MPPMPVLKRTLEIDAPPTEVWRVLTTPELVREWAAAYLDGISIRTSWREGEKVTWKAPNGSTRACGAHDWCSLQERMHYILHLFRAYQEDAALLSAPFTGDQVRAFGRGIVPDGVL